MTTWKPGDEANGHRLNSDGQWVPITNEAPRPPAPTAWKVGDVANGHVLTEHGWLPLQGPPVRAGHSMAAGQHAQPNPSQFVPLPPKPKKTASQKWIIAGASCLGVGVLIAVIAVAATGATPAGASAQQPFVDVVQAGQQASVPNDPAVVSAKQARGVGICDILPNSLKVQDWEGTVEAVDTALGGDKGTLSVEIAPDVAVTTAQGGFLETDTMIDPSSDLFPILGTLKVGQTVRFSGKFNSDSDMCIKEDSLMSKNGLVTPDFLMTFSAIEPVD